MRSLKIKKYLTITVNFIVTAFILILWSRNILLNEDSPTSSLIYISYAGYELKFFSEPFALNYNELVALGEKCAGNELQYQTTDILTGVSITKYVLFSDKYLKKDKQNEIQESQIKCLNLNITHHLENKIPEVNKTILNKFAREYLLFKKEISREGTKNLDNLVSIDQLLKEEKIVEKLLIDKNFQTPNDGFINYERLYKLTPRIDNFKMYIVNNPKVDWKVDIATNLLYSLLLLLILIGFNREYFINILNSKIKYNG
jgi:hypothetical protein